VYLLLGFLQVRPANQPTVTIMALCQRRFRANTVGRCVDSRSTPSSRQVLSFPAMSMPFHLLMLLWLDAISWASNKRQLNRLSKFLKGLSLGFIAIKLRRSGTERRVHSAGSNVGLEVYKFKWLSCSYPKSSIIQWNHMKEWRCKSTHS